MPFFSSFTGSFLVGRRKPISIGGGGGGASFGFSASYEYPNDIPLFFAEGFTLSSTGSKIYLKNGAASNIKQIDLTTPYDLSTATNNGVEKTFTDAGSQGGIRMDADGGQVYIIDADTTKLKSYTLSSAYDISTASSTANYSYSVGGLAFDLSADRTKLITITGGNTIAEHSMSIAGRIDTASTTGNTFLISGIGGIWGIAYTPDGSEIWVVDATTDNITKVNLSTPYDLSTASLGDSIDISSITGNAFGLDFSSDGSKVYFLNSGIALLEYNSGISGGS